MAEGYGPVNGMTLGALNRKNEQYWNGNGKPTSEAPAPPLKTQPPTPSDLGSLSASDAGTSEGAKKAAATRRAHGGGQHPRAASGTPKSGQSTKGGSGVNRTHHIISIPEGENKYGEEHSSAFEAAMKEHGVPHRFFSTGMGSHEYHVPRKHAGAATKLARGVARKGVEHLEFPHG